MPRVKSIPLRLDFMVPSVSHAPILELQLAIDHFIEDPKQVRMRPLAGDVRGKGVNPLLVQPLQERVNGLDGREADGMGLTADPVSRGLIRIEHELGERAEFMASVEHLLGKGPGSIDDEDQEPSVLNPFQELIRLGGVQVEGVFAGIQNGWVEVWVRDQPLDLRVLVQTLASSLNPERITDPELDDPVSTDFFAVFLGVDQRHDQWTRRKGTDVLAVANGERHAAPKAELHWGFVLNRFSLKTIDIPEGSGLRLQLVVL